MKDYSMLEAADILGCSRRRIQTLINGDKKKGTEPVLNYYRIGRKNRIRHQDLFEFRDSRLSSTKEIA